MNEQREQWPKSLIEDNKLAASYEGLNEDQKDDLTQILIRIQEKNARRNTLVGAFEEVQKAFRRCRRVTVVSFLRTFIPRDF